MYNSILRSLFLLSMISSLISCQSKTGKNRNIYNGEITFTDTICNLGTFSKSKPKHICKFAFKNTGLSSIAILDVAPSCKCISANYPRNAIRVGQNGEIEVTFDGEQASPGYFNKSVRVRINSTRIYTLKIIGIMEK